MTVLELLHAADAAYYEGREPLLSDRDYDRMARAAGHQSFVTAELPSLCNAICESELIDWLDDIPEADRLFHLEVKVDGCSVLVQFQDGHPIAARTRKLDVPVEVLTIPTRPDGFTGSARGEAWHPRGRNYAAGRLRARDAGAGLLWMPFCASAAERDLWPAEAMSPWCLTTCSTAEILQCWAAWKRGEIAPTVPTDGLVVKLADPAARARAGEMKRAPLWALALK